MAWGPTRTAAIATGAAPAVPSIAGNSDVKFLTSRTAPALDRRPRSLLIIGGRMTKLVAKEGSLRLLGDQLLAPERADSIQTAVPAIKRRLTVTDLAETLFPYLTTVEGLKLAPFGLKNDARLLLCGAG